MSDEITTETDDPLAQEHAGAYYDDEITFEELKARVGPEKAANFRVLKSQLDSIRDDTDATGEDETDD